MTQRQHAHRSVAALVLAIASSLAREEPVRAGPPTPLTPTQVASNMQSTYGAATSFEADFDQRYRAKAFGKTIDSRGHVTFEQPDRFLFVYGTPAGNVTVSDGKWLRIYSAASKTSCEGAATASMIPAAFAFLSGKKSLAVDFNLSLLPVATCAYPTGYCLVAKPKIPTPAYDFISFKVEGATFTVPRVTIVDASGNTNRFDFTKPMLSAKIKSGSFSWKPPAGTTIKPLGAC